MLYGESISDSSSTGVGSSKLKRLTIKDMSYTFKLVRACRCSFAVRFENGEHAYISNQNLLYLMQHPDASFVTVERRDSRNGMITKWVMIEQVVWTFGFKTRLFGLDGKAL